jgi:hypothetical protein
MAGPVRLVTHDGLAGVELLTSALRLVAVYGIGPRVAWFGPARGATNLLLWESPPVHRREVADKATWSLRGGHRVWAAQLGADESETTYRPDDAAGSCEVHVNGFTVSSARDPETRTRKVLSVRILREDRLEVISSIVNEGDLLCGTGVWALTCTRPSAATRYVVPLGDGEEWDTATVTVFRRWAGHGSGSFRDSPQQFEMTDDAYVLTPRGQEAKRTVRAPHGSVAMVDPERGLTFAIRAEYQNDAQYPCGANVALYVGPDNFMVEMETMGSYSVLKPGKRVDHRQEWTLAASAVALTGTAVRQLTA